MRRGPNTAAWLALAFWIIGGAWAFVSPSTFFESVANFPPYNAHFLRDAGAFMLGLGAAIGFALRWSDVLAVALGATAVAGVFHVISHVMDRAQGGSVRDTVGLGVFAVALSVAAWAQHRDGKKGASTA